MADPVKLTDEQQTFIVQSLACFDSPQTVAAAVKAEFDIVVSRQLVHRYDPTRKRGEEEVAEAWKALFAATRKKFLDDAAETGIANKSVRLRKYQRIADAAESRGNHMLVLQACEAAAKEMGGAFTNRREHSGPGGGPIPHEVEKKPITDRDRAKAIAALVAKQRAAGPEPESAAVVSPPPPAAEHGKPA